LDGGILLPQRDDLKPLILTGDFNVNFASDTSIRLIEFLQQQLNCLNLQMSNDRYTSGTTIDSHNRVKNVHIITINHIIISTVVVNVPSTQNIQP